jgi:hypothetical protein
MTKNAVELFRKQYKQAAEWFAGTLADVDAEVASYVPPGGLISPIAGQMGHIVLGLDMFLLNMIGGRPPLLFSNFADREVFSEPPPESGEFLEWGQRVKIDSEAMHAYANAVFEAVDSLLDGMNDEDLDREVDFGAMGKQTITWAFIIMLLNTHAHTGEIAAIKGLQGLKGYPM